MQFIKINALLYFTLLLILLLIDDSFCLRVSKRFMKASVKNKNIKEKMKSDNYTMKLRLKSDKGNFNEGTKNVSAVITW